MPKYVNVGGPFQIIDTPHKIEVWGETVEIPEDLARSAILSGAHLLPADQFTGFTPEELKYTNARLQADAPPEFHKKLATAQQAARAYRDTLAGVPPATGIRHPASASESTEVKS